MNLNSIRLSTPIITIFLLLVLINGCGNGNENEFVFTAPNPVLADNKHLLAVYMVGSDLESKYGAATQDLEEMVDGLAGLTGPERERLDLFIAFGGADKDGWRGVKWMNAEGLLTDAEDGIFGNEPDQVYLLVDNQKSMAEPAVLTEFLAATAQRQAQSEYSFVDFWDHGGSYRGFGNDDVTGKALSLTEIRQSLDASGLAPLDLIGFDACLMASLEVAQSLHGTCDLLIASEETEPGHGWNYRYVVPAFARTSDLPMYARGLVDDYVDSSNHPFESEGKTLSVLDMNRFPSVIAALDPYATNYSATLTQSTGSRVAFARAVTTTQAFGVGSSRGVRYSIDLEEFIVQSIFFGVPTDNSAGELVDVLKSFVLYVANDGTIDSTLGVSVIPPDRTAVNIAPSLLPGNGWRMLVQNVLELIANDLTGPVLVSLTPNSEGVEAEYADQLLTYVDVIHGLSTPDGRLLELFQESAAPIPLTSRWQVETWDGRTIHLVDGATQRPLPLSFVQVLQVEGQSAGVYGSRIQLLESVDGGGVFDDGTLYLAIGEDGSVLDYEIRTSLTDEEGNIIEGKTIEELHAGDQLRVFAQTHAVGSQKDPEFAQLGNTIILGQSPQFIDAEVQPEPGFSRAYAVLGQDLAGNVTLSSLFNL